MLGAQYVNGVGPPCSLSAPIYATQITVQQPIVSNITSVPTVSNQIGYTQTVVATGRVAIAQNTWTNVNSLSVTLVNLGVYIIVNNWYYTCRSW